VNNNKSGIWLITGGGRSGKSAYAESLAAADGAAANTGVLYIATGVRVDEEMEERIEHHRARRPGTWVTLEKYKDFNSIENEFEPGAFCTILLDCITNLLMGILFEKIPDAENFQSAQFDEVEQLSISEIDIVCAYAKKYEKRLILVTNEIGMGTIPPTRYARYYRDALGRVNMHAAKISDKVVMMDAGLPVELK